MVPICPPLHSKSRSAVEGSRGWQEYDPKKPPEAPPESPEEAFFEQLRRAVQHLPDRPSRLCRALQGGRRRDDAWRPK
eukprot:5153228-Pyramimonas_sp.AAC.1